jgi:hypothetical protein
MVLCVGGAGCGASTQPSTPPISKAAFHEKAEAICLATYASIKAKFLAFVKGKAHPFSSAREVREYAATVLVPAKKAEVSRLHALGAPSGDEDRVAAIVNAYEEGIQRAEEDPREAVSSTFGVFGTATERAEEYGLKNCHY